MRKLSKDYPRKYSRKEIHEVIDTLSENIMPDSQSHFASQAGANRLLKLGKIQLGINELQSRQSKIVVYFTVLMSIFSLLIAGTVLIFVVHNARLNKDALEKIFKQDSQMLLEPRSIGDQVKTEDSLRHDADTLNKQNIK